MSGASRAPGSGMVAAAWENVTRQRNEKLAELARLESDRQAVFRYGSSEPYEPDYPVEPVAALGLVPAARVEAALASMSERLSALETAIGTLPRVAAAVEALAAGAGPGVDEALLRVADRTGGLERALRDPLGRIEEGVSRLASRLDGSRAPAPTAAPVQAAAIPLAPPRAPPAPRPAPRLAPAPQVPEVAAMDSEEAGSPASLTKKPLPSLGNEFLDKERDLFNLVDLVIKTGPNPVPFDDIHDANDVMMALNVGEAKLTKGRLRDLLDEGIKAGFWILDENEKYRHADARGQ